MSSSDNPWSKSSNKKRKSKKPTAPKKKRKSEGPTTPKKKRKSEKLTTDSKTPSSNKKKKTPYEIWEDKFNKFMKANEFLGSILVKGIERDENDDDDEEDEEAEEDTSKYTKEQMDSLRHIMVTKNREKQLNAMRKLVLGDQANEYCLFFNTSFSYHIRDSLKTLRGKLTRAKTPSAKFDILFAYTHQVKEHNVWMHDNEGDMDTYTKGLATIWKRLLKNSDKDLGIDTEHTKPGIMAMLEKFREQAESPDAGYGNMKFAYK